MLTSRTPEDNLRPVKKVKSPRSLSRRRYLPQYIYLLKELFVNLSFKIKAHQGVLVHLCLARCQFLSIQFLTSHLQIHIMVL